MLEDSRLAKLHTWLVAPETRGFPLDLFLAALGEKLGAVGIPVSRISCSVLTKHPEVTVENCVWVRESGSRLRLFPHAVLQQPFFTRSPAAKVLAGARARLGSIARRAARAEQGRRRRARAWLGSIARRSPAARGVALHRGVRRRPLAVASVIARRAGEATPRRRVGRSTRPATHVACQALAKPARCSPAPDLEVRGITLGARQADQLVVGRVAWRPRDGGVRQRVAPTHPATLAVVAGRRPPAVVAVHNAIHAGHDRRSTGQRAQWVELG